MSGLPKITICVHDQPGNVGGPVVWIRRLLPELRQRGFETRCLFLTWGGLGATGLSLQAEGFDCPSVECPATTEERIRWILSRLQENPPDIFVSNVVVAAYFASRWVMAAGIPALGVLHSDDAHHQALQAQFLAGDPANRLTAMVCVSHELEQQARGRSRGQTLVRRIPYGVAVPSEPVRRKAGRFRLAYVGRLVEEQKQISALTRALCRVVRMLPGTDALIIGDGPDRNAVERVLATEGAGLPVILAGRVDSEVIQDRLLDCDVIVLLSDYEGLPIALLEGMACGCVPVCLQMRSGIPELVQPEVTGLIVQNRDEDFLTAIRRLQQEPGLWERLSQAARARVAATYSSESSAVQWAGLLGELSNPGSSKARINIPAQFDLPPVHPGLAREDLRAPLPDSFARKVMLRGRRFAGRIRRRIVGSGSLS